MKDLVLSEILRLLFGCLSKHRVFGARLKYFKILFILMVR